MATITLSFLPNQVRAVFPISINYPLDHSGISLRRFGACLAHCEFNNGGLGIYTPNIIFTTVSEDFGPYLSRQLFPPTRRKHSILKNSE